MGHRPPEIDAEFAASMEEVLDVYAREAVRSSVSGAVHGRAADSVAQGDANADRFGTKRHPRRVDYEAEYERAGTASIFMFCEPLAGWRRVTVRERPNEGMDWAQEMESPTANSLPVGREGHLGLRQLEHAYQGGPSTKAFSPPTGREPWCDSWNSATRRSTWQLVEHRRESVDSDDAAVRHRPSFRDGRGNQQSDDRLAHEAQQCGDSEASTTGKFQVDHARVKLKSIYPILEV